MSQPFDRGANVSPPGELDPELGEFWVANPWFIQQTENLSAFERNRLFLNAGRGRFVELSRLSGADSDGDGRSIVAGDFRGTGQLDLVVRQTGGGALLLFENQIPPRNWLTVSLRGARSNSLGIGARLTLTADGRSQCRELYPANSYHSQMPSRVHFGLGDSRRIDQLTVRWPSGTTQVFDELPVNKHVLLAEGSKRIDVVSADE